ncbi:Kelch repeat-containing protein 3 [Blastocladiella emersonii ATCC 22665]|nr:Kelch repeat-containing protein 3 [Blastocladiella emersonii ATCC 22665]
MAKDKKKKKGSKEEKKQRVAEKNERKTQKKEKKNKKKAAAAGSDSDEEDIEAIIEAFKKRQEEEVRITDEVVADPPSRRSNASITVNPLNPDELILFGGEWYDGRHTIFNNNLYFYNVEKNEWRKISSPNSPGPRSSHQMVATPNGLLFCFSGEFASKNESQFLHYKDFWKFDVRTKAWEKLDPKIKPSPRSGHRMTLWKNYIVLFGGFYETYAQTKYYDDLWVFNLQDYKWTKIEIPDHLGSRPTARSGFQMFAHKDHVFVYGGYCKQFVKGQKVKGVTHTDLWALKMTPDLKHMRWERRKKMGYYPGPRAGATMTVWKDRAILFGGVQDVEISDELMESTCFNDMYAYQMESNKWYSMTLRSKKQPKQKKKDRSAKPAHLGAAGGADSDREDEPSNNGGSDDDESGDEGRSRRRRRRNRNKEQQEQVQGENAVGFGEMEDFDNYDWSGWGSEFEDDDKDAPKKSSIKGEKAKKAKAEAEAAAAAAAAAATAQAEGDDASSRPETPASDSPAADASESAAATPEKKAKGGKSSKKKKKVPSFGDDDEDDAAPATATAEPSPAAKPAEDDAALNIPRPRFNTMLGVARNALYLYGGIIDVKGNEHTLEDLWTLNLDKLDEWRCLVQSDLGQWAGSDDEDDDDDSDDDDEEVDTDDEGDFGLLGVPMQEDEDDEGGSNAAEAAEARAAAVKAAADAKAEAEAAAEAEKKSREEELRKTLEMQANLPKVKETLRDYYARTTNYWVNLAMENAGEAANVKSIKRDAFALAQVKYEEYLPILEELRKLDVDMSDNSAAGPRDASQGGLGAGAGGVLASRNRR